jgi:hypothetical protein
LRKTCEWRERLLLPSCSRGSVRYCPNWKDRRRRSKPAAVVGRSSGSSALGASRVRQSSVLESVRQTAHRSHAGNALMTGSLSMLACREKYRKKCHLYVCYTDGRCYHGSLYNPSSKGYRT